MARLLATALIVFAATTTSALAQDDAQRDRFLSFVDRVAAGAAELEDRARKIADDVAQTVEFERAERGVNELRSSVSAFARTLGEKTDVETLSSDMQAWIDDNQARIAELDDVSSRNRARLRRLWDKQARLVERINERLEEARELLDEDLELLAEEKTIRAEMAKAGAERMSRRAQIRAAQEITSLARQLRRVRQEIEKSIDQLSPES